MSYADPSDVAVELGRPVSSVTGTDVAQWQAWLDRVERSIERTFRRAGLTFSAQVSLGDPSADEVRDVEVAAVVRKVQNPTWGVTSTTRSIDDASVTSRREGAGVDADPLDLLADEWSSLLPGSDSPAFSTRPGFDPDYPVSHPETVFDAADHWPWA